ncbi:ras-GEF domain-containing protein, partial [Nephila pilipes]
IFSNLLCVQWGEKKLRQPKADIPFFWGFMHMLYKELKHKERISHIDHESKKLRTFLPKLFQWQNRKRKQETLVNRLTNALISNNNEKKNVQTRKHKFEELVISYYRHLEEVFNVIEDCRKYYTFTINSPPVDEETRHFLLCKKI